MVGLSELRAPLFVPANRPDRFGKAASSGTDAVILDLEDAVAPDAKIDARGALSCGFTELPIIVRINAIGTSWHDDDVAAVKRLPFAAVMLPKTESAAQVQEFVKELGDNIAVLALIENAKGLANARPIAACKGVARLAFGSIDFCADLGCAHKHDILLPARSELVLASRLASIAAPIDGVTTQIDDPDGLNSDVKHAREIGMTGKLCIHPKQIAAVRRAFSPTASEIAWAKRVLNSGDGAVSIDGVMVDEPVRIRARTILATV